MSDGFLVVARCTTCDSDATLVMLPERVPTARCMPCIKAGMPIKADPLPTPVYPRRVTGPVTPMESYTQPGSKVETDKDAPAVVRAPEHTSRDPWPADIDVPRGALTLRKTAEQYGWTVTLTYARGYPDGETLTHSIAVRCDRDGHRAVTVYERPDARDTWTSKTVLLSGGPTGIFAGAGATQCKEFLLAGGDVVPGWYTAIADSALAKAATAKQHRDGIHDACGPRCTLVPGEKPGKATASSKKLAS